MHLFWSPRTSSRCPQTPPPVSHPLHNATPQKTAPSAVTAPPPAQSPKPAPQKPPAKNWGDSAATRLLCEVVRAGNLQRAETCLRKGCEDARNPRRHKATLALAKSVQALHPQAPAGLPQLLCAVGKNGDVERIQEMADCLHLAAQPRYLPLWQALVKHKDFTASTGPRFADYNFAQVLSALPRLDAAHSGTPVRHPKPHDVEALEKIVKNVCSAPSAAAACTALQEGLHALEKAALYRMFVTPANAADRTNTTNITRATEVNAAIAHAVVDDPACRASLQLLVQRCAGKNSLQQTTATLMQIVRPAVAQFCAPGPASVAERRSALQATIDAHPKVRAEAAALLKLGYQVPADGMPRSYNVPVKNGPRQVPVQVRIVQHLLDAAHACENYTLGGCYAAASPYRSSKPLENGISPASRFICVRDAQGRELETVEAGFTPQGLWIDRFEQDHALDLSGLWTDYLTELVRSGAVPQVVVRKVPDPRAYKSPWFAVMASARPQWCYTGPKIALERINQVFPQTYYDTQWDAHGGKTYVDDSCLVITPKNVD